VPPELGHVLVSTAGQAGHLDGHKEKSPLSLYILRDCGIYAYRTDRLACMEVAYTGSMSRFHSRRLFLEWPTQSNIGGESTNAVRQKLTLDGSAVYKIGVPG
jgi:hypothetical protein